MKAIRESHISYKAEIPLVSTIERMHAYSSRTAK